MQSNFSQMDMLVIRQQLVRMTDEDIADLLGKPVAAVSEQINVITGLTSRKSKSQKLAGRAKKTTPRKKERLKKTKEDRALEQLNKQRAKEQYAKANGLQMKTDKVRRPKQPQFKTIVVDYSAKRLIRVDAKTSIYIGEDEDAAEAIKKYLKRIDTASIASADGRTPHKPPVKAVPKQICPRCELPKKPDEFYSKSKVCITCTGMVKRLKQEDQKYL